MDPDVEAALKILDEIEPVPTGPIELPQSYLKAVKMVEDHPDNLSGADKTWVQRAIRQFSAFFQRVRLG